MKKISNYDLFENGYILIIVAFASLILLIFLINVFRNAIKSISAKLYNHNKKRRIQINKKTEKERSEEKK